MEPSTVRLQIVTPLSVLLSIASVLFCETIASPSISNIARLHPTSITPSTTVVKAYVATLWLAQIAYCVGLTTVLTIREETKVAVVKGVGFWLVSANLVLALWPIAWVTQQFLIATILQSLLLLFLLCSNFSLIIYHLPPTAITHPLNTLLVHAPLRFFLILPLHLLFPVCLFITLHLSYPPTPSGPPQDPAAWHTTPAFLILLSTHLFSLVIIAIRRDIVWSIGATWAAIAIWYSTPKPALIYITALTFTLLHPLALITSFVYHLFHKRSRPAIYLQPDEEHPPRETPEEALGGV